MEAFPSELRLAAPTLWGRIIFMTHTRRDRITHAPSLASSDIIIISVLFITLTCNLPSGVIKSNSQIYCCHGGVALSQAIARIARGQTHRLTSGSTTPLQGAAVQNLLFSPLKRGRDPGSQPICLPPRYPGKDRLVELP